MKKTKHPALEGERVTLQRFHKLPLNEKLKLLEKLRDRSLAIAKSPLRKSSKKVA